MYDGEKKYNFISNYSLVIRIKLVSYSMSYIAGFNQINLQIIVLIAVTINAKLLRIDKEGLK